MWVIVIIIIMVLLFAVSLSMWRYTKLSNIRKKIIRGELHSCKSSYVYHIQNIVDGRPVNHVTGNVDLGVVTYKVNSVFDTDGVLSGYRFSYVYNFTKHILFIDPIDVTQKERTLQFTMIDEKTEDKLSRLFNITLVEHILDKQNMLGRFANEIIRRLP